MDLPTLIREYGYLALFIGTFLEGETILVLAGFSAQRGFLSLPLVMLIAALGAFAGDQMFFLLGRRLGRSFVERTPARILRVARVRALLHRRRVLALLGYRFLYGLRSITPMAIGASGFSPAIFAFWSGIGAVIWAVVVGFLGFFFGRVAERVLAEIQEYELFILAGLAALGLLAFIAHIVRGRLKAQAAARMGILPPPPPPTQPPTTSHGPDAAKLDES